MNTKNNKRKQASTERIKNAFFDALRTKELTNIKVSELCKAAQINRSTFYARYLDIYDLADQIYMDLKREVDQMFDLRGDLNQSQNEFLKLFQHMRSNREVYWFYFKLGYENRNWQLKNFLEMDFSSEQDLIDYHVAFFKHGFNAIVKMWVENGCKETPEQMCDVLLYEYRGRFGQASDVQ